ncbi:MULTISPECIES: hypothetical protein [Roseomonadaceae]|uniref:VPEID-CTERM sorting domain-containing protein n=1 Tax=Falsiroseomonas oleicola TaxID=2801474 RepID=A0ABS6H4R3_9PROT|nr:hypothetical protein [Roseomonas oleicola]MBU8543381.1 hypothetical protein [Roseomonas oleicola]
MRVLVFLLTAMGLALAGTGLVALFSRATGWEIRTRPTGASPGLTVPTDLDFALIFTGIGLALLGLAWLLRRRATP